MNLEKMAEKYRDAGYSERNADARVCQDIVLKAIARSNLGRNVTIKGGVVMRSITGNVRRATEDLDLDFIRYSLEDESIRYAFTEQGIYMLATVLRGELAEQQSIFIMRAFMEMRHYIKQNQQFVTQSEMRLVTAKVSEISVQVAGAVDWKNKAEERFDSIQKSIDTLNENFVSDKDFKNFVIYKGQKFEADVAYIDIYQQAKKSIYVVDDYVNTKTLQLLSQKQVGV